jgi:transposase-like protein
MLLEMAEREPDRRPLVEYSDVICVLRDEKKFTFREIAEWLRERGVEADHNAVYRAYTRGMPVDAAYGEARADEELEMEEARSS